MTNKTTKRALLTSVMALFLCFTMLLGTTFAWFTDSVTSTGNKIIAGTLDVDLYMWTDTSNSVEITNEGAPIFGSDNSLVAQDNAADTLWEPGKTQVVYLSIKNDGNLDLKYQVALEVKNVTKNLTDVVEYAITPDAKYGELNGWNGNGTSVVAGLNATQAQNVVLEKGAEHFFALSVHMDEEAGNDYMNGSIEFDIKVLATQLASEEDSFGPDYDKDATFPVNTGATVPVDSNATEIVVEIKDNTSGETIGTVTVPKAALAADVTEVTVTVKESETPDGIILESNLGSMTLDINIAGLKEGNDKPVEVSVFYAKGLNNVKLYHNEDRIACSYNAETGFITFKTTSFSLFTAVYAYEPIPEDEWDGTADISWYDPENLQKEYTFTTAEQLRGLSELCSGDTTFAGVTFTLANNLDLFCEDTSASADGDPVTFRPIGDHSKNGTFEGTFDGAEHTIFNLYQNGWDLGYEWGNYGSYGLFGNVNDATIKNLRISGSESYIEGGDTSFVAGSATGTCVFENIIVTDSVSATYNNGNGGIIGWSGVGNYTFKDITIEEGCVLAGLWGSFDSSIGGVVGQAEPGATYNFENVEVNCRIDAYNDCTASYDYYNYRMCGMLIGRLEETTTINGANYPDTSKYNITCNNVTVNYGEWYDYHYCRAEGARAKRVEAGYSYDGIATDYDHSVCKVHHLEGIPFDQIFGGDQYGVKGLESYEGVTVNYPNN